MARSFSYHVRVGTYCVSFFARLHRHVTATRFSRGSLRSTMRVLLFAVAVLGSLASISALPSGFEDQSVLSDALGGGFPTDFAFFQDLLVVVEKSGQILVFQDTDGDSSYATKTEALDMTSAVCDNNENGVQGVGIHPDFETTRYLYVYYTFNKGGGDCESEDNVVVNRLSRFVLPETYVVDSTTETVLMETQPLEFATHNGGDINFGADGNLYVSVGDGGYEDTSILNEGNLLGSILCLTPDGDIPATNPFVGEDSVRCNVGGVVAEEGQKCQEIYALGYRNPFRFAIDASVTDKVVINLNDVGSSGFEEINRIGTDFAGMLFLLSWRP